MPRLGPMGPVGIQSPGGLGNYRTRPAKKQVFRGIGAAGPVGPQGPQGPVGPQPRYLGPANPAPAARSLGLASATTAPGGGSYDDAFRASLAASRAGIEQQFKSALADIGAREAAAGQALGLLPGQVQGVFDRGNANLATAQATMDAAQKTSGLTSYAPASAQMAPISAAIGQDLAARQADVPLLRLGNQQLFSQQRGGLQQARLGAMSDIDAEERGYLADAAARKEERDFQLSQRGSDIMDQDWLAQREFQRQSRAAQQEAQAARAEEGRALNNFGAADISPERGAWMKAYNPDEYDRIVGSEGYRWAQQRLGSKKAKQGIRLFGGSETYDVDDVVKDLQRRGLYRTAAIFAYRNKKGRVGSGRK